MSHDDTGGPTGFASLGLRPETLAALARLGYEEPTPIQRETFAPLTEGRDLLGQAATGTGKTAAFALPILERLARDRHVSSPVALVLVPTRELAVQVSEAVYRYGRDLDAQVLPVYGGQPIVRQLKVLSRGVDVVVATPGRARDLLQRRALPLDAVQVVVLDEADEMLDMGFAEDIEAILEATPDGRQTVLFSATMPPRLDGIVKRHLRDPLRIQMGRAAASSDGAPLVRQVAYLVARAHKPAALGRVLDIETPTAAIVFCRTRIEVDQVTETLNGRGYRAEALHGGMDQAQRDRVMGRLRAGSADLLVATDVAARGLDIDQLTHVVNYDVPSAPEAYVHRIGRVGRAGREGVAVTLAEPRERRLLANIERVTKRKLPLEPVPTVADLRARQLDATLRTLRESMEADDLEDYRPVLDALGDPDEVDLAEVALAALRLAHQASGVTLDEEEIPEVKVRKDREGAGPAAKRGGADDRGSGRPGGKPTRALPGGPSATIFVGLGRSSGVRPQDLVGAIANETRLNGKDIGAIRIQDSHAIVEVPAAAVDEVIATLKRTTIKGKKATVRRDRHEGR
jgi:ATP-dependent RNA helicase DeaD